MARRKRRMVTAAELVAKLEADPEYRRKEREQERKRAAFEAELAKDEANLVKDLARAGVRVTSVWDLVNTQEPYPNAIPVLLDHLKRSHHRRIREGIVRALSVPEAQDIAFSDLYREFQSISVEEDFQLKWLVGGALAEATTPSELPLVLDLIKDPQHGKGRELLICVLKRLPPEERRRIAGELSASLDDPGLVQTAKSLQGGPDRPKPARSSRRRNDPI